MILSHSLTTLWRLIFPQRCTICHQRMVATERSLCTVCFFHLPRTRFARTPYDNKMARLLWGRTWIEKAASLFFYTVGSASANLIHDLKYRNKPQIGYELSRMIVREDDFCDFFNGIDAIIPMPITKKRKRERGYNQCDYIAEGLSVELRLPIIRDAVRRNSFSKSQTSVNHLERLKNVEDVFSLEKPERISGKHILLIDDVMTTGATIVSCINEIRKASDVKVSVLTLAFAG